MTSELNAVHIPEPDLIFKGRRDNKDPRTGLVNFGPYAPPDAGDSPDSISVGIIGDKTCIRLAGEMLVGLRREIKSKSPNKWLFSDYPGMNESNNFRCSIKLSHSWNQTLSETRDLSRFEKIRDSKVRIGRAVDLYIRMIEKITSHENSPDVILCTLPKTVEKNCAIGERTRDAKDGKFTDEEKRREEHERSGQTELTAWMSGMSKPDPVEKGFDFRDSLKGKSMKYGVPIQLIKESTLQYFANDGRTSGKQDRATIAWNLSTALYYKKKGTPWRLVRLDDAACYVGVSFFRNRLSTKRDMHISMAQVFTSTGEGLVLRGTEVDIDEKTKLPHLTEDQAHDLLQKSLKKYMDQYERTPERVVIHKSSLFSEDERAGFERAILGNDIHKNDLVAILQSPISLMRWGKYPVLRGTMLELGPGSFILYTSGYSPEIRTYQGHKIPRPLRIEHSGDTQNDEIAKEILGLTKLNWNTADFSTSRPITLEFARRVGTVLSELRDDSHVKDHYKFFM